MQSTATQISTRAAPETVQQGVGIGRRNKQSPAITDPFLQIILGLLTASPEQAPSQGGALSQTAPELADEQAAVLMSELAALQLLPFGYNTVATGETAAQPEPTMPLVSLQAAAETSLAGTGTVILNPEALAEAGPQTPATPQPTQTTAGKAGLAANAAQTVVQAESSRTDESLPPITQLRPDMPLDGTQSGQDALSEAVAKAKQLLSQTSQRKVNDPDDIDVDKLQNTLAKTDTAQPFALRFKPAASAVAESPLAEQLMDGIKQNLSAGKGTFVVKLNPAELGEITVRLVEEAGKTTLTLAAANAQTAKLLNHDLAALREAVAPMNVEVREAVVATNETADSAMQQFNLAGQQFAQQQFAGSQGYHTAAQSAFSQSDAQPAEELYEAAQPLSALRYSANRLDAYV